MYILRQETSIACFCILEETMLSLCLKPNAVESGEVDIIHNCRPTDQIIDLAINTRIIPLALTRIIR